VVTKQCNRCKAVKPVDEFYGDRTARDGLQGKCKDCSKAVAKAWHEHNPPDPDRRREIVRQFHERNPDKDREYGRAYRERHGERYNDMARARNVKHRRAKPERHVASEMRRRAKLAQITSEDMDYMAILRRDPCAYCGPDGESTIDHIHPLRRGGTSDWGNLTAACRHCNGSKGTGDLLSFLLRKSA
jgi:5-methylcytosine-specific restriction endonuclease McrA